MNICQHPHYYCHNHLIIDITRCKANFFYISLLYCSKNLIFLFTLSLSSPTWGAPHNQPNSRQLPFNSSCRAAALNTRVYFCSSSSAAVLLKEEVQGPVLYWTIHFLRKQQQFYSRESRATWRDRELNAFVFIISSRAVREGGPGSVLERTLFTGCG